MLSTHIGHGCWRACNSLLAGNFELVYSPAALHHQLEVRCVWGGGGGSSIYRSMSPAAPCAGKCYHSSCAPCKTRPSTWCSNQTQEEKIKSKAKCTGSGATWCAFDSIVRASAVCASAVKTISRACRPPYPAPYPAPCELHTPNPAPHEQTCARRPTNIPPRPWAMASTCAPTA